jgi:proteasome accessory factor C
VSTTGTGPSRGPNRGGRATERVLRMLNVVPWIAAHDGPTIADVCERFGIDRGQLVDDLRVVQLVGLPPYTPDMLIEVGFEGERVWVRFADVFARPLRLSPNQALGLVAAGSALAGDHGGEETPLATGLAKLAALLDVDPAEAMTIRLGPSRPDVLSTLREAVRERHRVRLDYYSYSRDERTVREVDPRRLFAADGAWYVAGFCHLAGAARLFRVDRISAIEPLDVVFDADDTPADDAVFVVGPDAPQVTLELAPSARWVVETYPVDGVEELGGGRSRVRLTVGSRPWLERLLVRLGPDAELVATDDPALSAAGRDAARRILARYAASGG